MAVLLDKVNSPEDLKKLNPEELAQLCIELRNIILQTVKKNGGHLASNLGVVELTLALHLAFACPQDKLIWDVGHQSYAHKIITGRREQFATLRQQGGLSGFPKMEESPYDSFNTGHSSTSISAALGMATARDIQKEAYNVVAVIGDGALNGGMAFEALNQAGALKTKLIIVLNDNKMSISPNVGALSKHLNHLRSSKTYSQGKQRMFDFLSHIPLLGEGLANFARRIKNLVKYMLVKGMLFEELGFTYLGPVNGHCIADMQKLFEQAKAMDSPVLIHVLTQKGRGYMPAEKSPAKFHGVSPYELPEEKEKNTDSFTSVFGNVMVEMALEQDKVTAICAAMSDGTGLNQFAGLFPNRFFDVGIAEQHAVTFAAGQASAGLKPIVAIYSTFFQRAYDQILHDVCLPNLPVILAIDRAGLVGEDGETHQGIYDIAYLRSMPNISIIAPKNGEELRNAFYTALQYPGPVAIRYAKGQTEPAQMDKKPVLLDWGKNELLREGQDVTIISYGVMLPFAMQAAEILQEKGIAAGVINARFMKPMDEDLLLQQVEKSGHVLIIEEHVLQGGLGSLCMEILEQHQSNVPVEIIALPDELIRHGKVSEIREQYGLTVENIVEKALLLLQRGN